MQAAFDLTEADGVRVLALRGDWTVRTIAGLDAPLRALALDGARLTVDVSALGGMDVAGAYLVERATQNTDVTFRGEHASARRLFDVARHARQPHAAEEDRLRGFAAFFDSVGRAIVDVRDEAYLTLAFLGRSLATLWRLMLNPRRIRWVSVVSVMETAGLNAMPIIALLSFFVGLVVAYLGARILGDFGASVFTVELVAFSVLREFGVVITAVLLAGRTDSAFTAQIGAMKMRQEIDAMRVLGLDPMEAIVAPRIIAMLIMTPILTFGAIIAGLFGGMLVCWAQINVSPVLFITRIEEAVPAQHFWVSMVKAPVVAIVVAIIGCRHGLETENDVTSLGQRVTASVVQAIFINLLLDAIFAVWFLEMDW